MLVSVANLSQDIAIHAPMHLRALCVGANRSHVSKA